MLKEKDIDNHLNKIVEEVNKRTHKQENCGWFNNFVSGMGGKILGQLEHTCKSTFQTRLAMQYNMITYHPWDGKFYFERIKKDD